LEQLRVLWKLIVPSENVFVRAEQLTATDNITFWDAMIVAACMEAASRTFTRKTLTIRSNMRRASKS